MKELVVNTTGSNTESDFCETAVDNLTTLSTQSISTGILDSNLAMFSNIDLNLGNEINALAF